MSLRARLTLLYTILVGGTLMIFGLAIYQLVSLTITEQIDQILERTASNIISAIRVNAVGNLDVAPDAANLDLATNVYVQLWSRDQGLKSSYNISWMTDSLDPLARYTSQPVTRDVSIGNAHIRVLSVPLSIGTRPAGTLQVGASLAVVDATRKTLLNVLVVGTIVAVAIAAFGVSFVTYRALSPLESVTQTALQITRADDLSRRIPYQGPTDDEIGQLINAFNQTLSRLENLFHTQRRFVADVGHELRTPLTVIKGNITLMRKIGCSDEESLSVEAVTEAIRSCRNTSPGPDGINSRMLRLLSLDRNESGRFIADEETLLVTMISKIYKIILRTTIVPTAWKTSFTVLSLRG